MALIYLIVNSYAMIFLLILFFSSRDKSARLAESRCFRAIMLMTIVALLGDMAAWQLNGIGGSVSRVFLWISNSLCYAVSSVMALCWLYYVLLKLNLRQKVSKWGWVLIGLPCAFIVVASVLSPWTRWLYSIDAGNVYGRGDLFFFQIITPLGYLLSAAVVACVQACRERLRQQRAECLLLGSFIVFPLIGGVLQIVVYGLSLAWPCTALSLLLVYVNLQSQRISLDALTGLNNRGQLDRYLYNCMERGDADGSFALIMLDVDDFKGINDQYGHIAGDAALVAAAESLKAAVTEHDAFLARYGGDEFAVVLSHVSETQVIDVIKRIGQETEKRSAEGIAQVHRIVFSAGYVCSDRHRFRHYVDMITAADARMYAQKQTHKNAAKH